MAWVRKLSAETSTVYSPGNRDAAKKPPAAFVSMVTAAVVDSLRTTTSAPAIAALDGSRTVPDKRPVADWPSSVVGEYAIAMKMQVVRKLMCITINRTQWTGVVPESRRVRIRGPAVRF